MGEPHDIKNRMPITQQSRFGYIVKVNKITKSKGVYNKDSHNIEGKDLAIKITIWKINTRLWLLLRARHCVRYRRKTEKKTLLEETETSSNNQTMQRFEKTGGIFQGHNTGSQPCPVGSRKAGWGR